MERADEPVDGPTVSPFLLKQSSCQRVISLLLTVSVAGTIGRSRSVVSAQASLAGLATSTPKTGTGSKIKMGLRSSQVNGQPGLREKKRIS